VCLLLCSGSVKASKDSDAEEATTAGKDAGEEDANGSDEEDVTWEDVLKSVQVEMGMKVEAPASSTTPSTEEPKSSTKLKPKKRKKDEPAAPEVEKVEKKSPRIEKDLKRRRKR
jgi:hypothetical protein